MLISSQIRIFVRQYNDLTNNYLHEENTFGHFFRHPLGDDVASGIGANHWKY